MNVNHCDFLVPHLGNLITILPKPIDGLDEGGHEASLTLHSSVRLAGAKNQHLLESQKQTIIESCENCEKYSTKPNQPKQPPPSTSTKSHLFATRDLPQRCH